MSKKEYEIYNLKKEIENVQREQEPLKEPEDKNANSSIFNFTNLALVISVILFIASPSVGVFLLAVFLMIAGISLDVYIEWRYLLAKNENIPEPPVFKKHQEYYYEEIKYAEALEEQMTEERRKYQEALERQNKNKTYDESPITYSKDDEINFLVEAIEAYFDCYKLPPLKATDYEWDIFFDTLYSEFRKRGVKDEFYHAVSEVIRYTLAHVLINENDAVTIVDFVANLRYLCKTSRNEGIIPDYFDIQDVQDIEDKMMFKIKKQSRERRKKYQKQL